MKKNKRKYENASEIINYQISLMIYCIGYDNAQMMELEKRERNEKAVMSRIKEKKKSPNCTTQH